MTLAISLKKMFRTPIFILLEYRFVAGIGFRSTVAGKVQKTIVVPKIDKIVEVFEGVAMTMF